MILWQAIGYKHILKTIGLVIGFGVHGKALVR